MTHLGSWVTLEYSLLLVSGISTPLINRTESKNKRLLIEGINESNKYITNSFSRNRRDEMNSPSTYIKLADLILFVVGARFTLMQLELECNTLATWSSLCFMHMQFVYPLHDCGRLPLSLNGVSVKRKWKLKNPLQFSTYFWNR